MKFKTCFLFVATLSVSGVSAGESIPLTKDNFLAIHGANALEIAPDVFLLTKGDRTRTVAFGIGGLRYDIERFRAMKNDKRLAGSKLIEEVSANLVDMEALHDAWTTRVAAKDAFAGMSCGRALDMEALYMDGFSKAAAWAFVDLQYDQFGPQFPQSYGWLVSAYTVAYTDTGILDSDGASAYVYGSAGAYVDAYVEVSFGQTCTLEASAAFSPGPQDCSGLDGPPYVSLVDEGPCVN